MQSKNEVDKNKISAAKDFAQKIHRNYPSLIKAIWFVPDGVQTVMFLIDDTQQLDLVSIDKLKAEAAAEAQGFEKKGIKVQPIFYNLTDYWELIRHGSPVTFTEIRDGIPLFDPSGFFIPMKKLLLQGRIPGTKEAMKSLLEEAPLRLLKIERVSMGRIVNELAAAVVDAGQAPLLLVGVAPPTARELGEKLKIHLVDKEFLEAEYVRYYEEVFGYMKAVEHGEVQHISPEEIEKLFDKTEKFVERMEKLMEELGKKGNL